MAKPTVAAVAITDWPADQNQKSVLQDTSVTSRRKLATKNLVEHFAVPIAALKGAL
jgi:hypothetical protein